MGYFRCFEEVPDLWLFLPAYKTVSGVNGPLVILDQVKVKTKTLNEVVEGSSPGLAVRV